MIEEPSTIKILLKYYKYPRDEIFSNSLNNDLSKTASNSFIALNNHNYKYSANSLISNEKSNYNIITNNITHNKKSKDFDKINILNELTQDYLIYFQTNFPYNQLENKYPPKVINIKSCIYLYLVEKKKLNITLDSLLLFKCNQNKFQLLNDEEIFHPIINITESNLETNNISDIICENNISNSTVIYYNINKDKIKIIVELYSKSIDHISLTISKMCSILILKYLILLKLKEIEKTKKISNLIDKNGEPINNNSSIDYSNIITMNEIEKELKIYGNGIVNNNFNDYISKKETNRNFNNNMQILEIYSYYINNMETSIIDNKSNNISRNISNISISISKDDLNDGILSFIMMEKKENKCSLGLDFRFTILQNFIPETEEDKNIKIISIKNYIKPESITKYGLNLYFNCLKKNCIYNTECFMLNIGYGNYDIFNLIKYNAYCPMCFISKKDFFNEKNKNNSILNENNNLDLKHIGMVNSKWAYKGYLIGIKMTNVEGKGMTVIKDVLYKTKEFDFLHQFKKLIFQIDNYTSKNKYIAVETKNDSSFCSQDYNYIYEESKININNVESNNKIIQFNTEENDKIIQDIPNEIINNDNNKIKIYTLDINNNLNTIFQNNEKCNEEDKNKEKDVGEKDINNNLKINNIIKKEQNRIDNNINSNTNVYNNIQNYIKNKRENNNNINKNTNINFDYKNINKKLNIKRNINLIRKINNTSGTYYGNARQVIQNGDGNDTNNTNVDFNIIIDKKKSNCCESCFDYQPVSQVCCIF